MRRQSRELLYRRARRANRKAALAEILRFDGGRAPGNGAMLATAGGLVFHGDMSRRFRAFDAETGTKLLGTVPELELPRGHNEIYVFALR